MSLIFDQYTDRLRRQGSSPHSVRAFTTAAKRLDLWLAGEGIGAEEATMGMLEEYFSTLPLADSSKGTHLRYIQAAYNYAIKRGSIRHNPALDVVVPDPPPTEPRTISTPCLRVIRERITYRRDWIWFHLLAYTGMRRGEVRGLRWEENVRLEEQTIRVIGKGQKPRLIPIHPALGEVLAQYRQDEGFVVPSDGKHGVALETIQDMSRRLSPTFTPHDYRRTVATSLGDNGVEDAIIDRIMGWAPMSIYRKFYRRVADPALHQAILRLYANDPL